jgi:hypothetical protein
LVATCRVAIEKDAAPQLKRTALRLIAQRDLGIFLGAVFNHPKIFTIFVRNKTLPQL